MTVKFKSCLVYFLFVSGISVPTSQKPASYLQGAVLGDTAGFQGGIILQWAPGKQQYLILDEETLQSLDMGLRHTTE